MAKKSPKYSFEKGVKNSPVHNQSQDFKKKRKTANHNGNKKKRVQTGGCF